VVETESRVAVVAALLGNAALAILKGIAPAVTGSTAMLADPAPPGRRLDLFSAVGGEPKRRTMGRSPAR
jgi:hypothetical protein